MQIEYTKKEPVGPVLTGTEQDTEGVVVMCKNYTTSGWPRFKPVCLKGLRAALKCHDKCGCLQYKT